MRTRKLVQPGDRIICPRCHQVFHLFPDEESLVETFPVAVDEAVLTSEQRVIPRTRSWESDETPIPKPNPAAVAAVQAKKRETTGGTPPLEASRATVAALLTIVLLGLVGLFLYWYAGTVRSLDRTAVAASQRRIESVNQFLKGKAASKVARAKTADRSTTDRTIAPATLEVAGTVVGVSSAEIGPIAVNNRETETAYLRLTLRVTNLLNKPFPFVGVHSAGAKAVLRDSSGNYFNQLRFSSSELAKGCITNVDIPPQETIRDLLVFENPGIQVSYFGQSMSPGDFELDLPLGARNYRFLIPGSMIRRPAPAMRFAPVAQAPPAPPRPVPAQPASAPEPVAPQPTPRDLILDDYYERWARAQQTAKPKVRNRALEYLRGKKQEIISELAKKYGMDRHDMKMMLPP
jgi:hypothetical protein